MSRKLNTLYAVLSMALLTGCMRSQTELCEKRVQNASIDLVQICENSSLPSRPLTLDDIIAIALESNLDAKVLAQEYAFEYEKATGAKYEMIPPLLAEGEDSYRNKNTGSASESLTNQPPAPPSISSQQHVNRYDITLAWNLLDFGIGYYKARQQNNKALTKRFDYERQRQNIVLNAIEHFWKAQAALKGVEKSQALLKKAQKFQEAREKDVKAQIVSNIEGFTVEAQLIRTILQMKIYEKTYNDEIAQLSNLMGLHPSATFELAPEEPKPITVVIDPVVELEALAFRNRPELFDSDLEAKIYEDDIRIALIQTFPDPTLFCGNFYDSNRFLVYNRWLIAGLRWSYNLLNTPGYIQDMVSADTHLDGSKANRLALSTGVLTQVNLAYLQYFDSLKEYEWNQKLKRVQNRLLASAIKEHNSGEMSGLDLLQIGIDTMVSEVDTLRTYGETLFALERINNSIGIPLYFTVEKDTHDTNILDYGTCLVDN